MAAPTPAITLHAPDSNVPAFGEAGFPFEQFLGTWHIISSTLPMWKGKQNCTLTYSRIEGHEPSEQMDDLVEYQKEGVEASSSRSTVRGIDKRDVEPLRDGAAGRTVGTRWKWRGRGWLMIASSRWQLLGFDLDAGIAVSYFKSTLFTPAGLDVIVRDPAKVTPELRSSILEAVRGVDDPEIAKLAPQLFDVPHKA